MKSIQLAMLLAFAFSGACGASHKDSYSVKKYEHKHGLGLKRHPKLLKELKKRSKKHQAFGGVVIPKATDLTPFVSPPEDQGPYGTCWAFGITKALRSALMLTNQDPGRLAVNYLIGDCGPGPAQGGCNQGGDFDAGTSMLNGHGPWLEAQDPYNCPHTGCKGLSVAATAVDWNVVGDGVHRPSFADLALALSNRHMLAIDVAVCGAWETYAGGIFNSNQCGANSINHIINMVGYDCQTSVDANGNCMFDGKGEPVNGDGFVIAMNNWGNSWGEKGYMRSRAHMDALADTAMFFTVKAAPVPPPPVPVPTPTPTPVPPVGTAMWLWFILGAVGLVGVIVLVEMVRGK